jgi:repressor LexA
MSSNVIGRNLEALTEIKDTNWEAIARIAGVSKAAVSQWKSGKTKNPNRDALQKIADYFGLQIDDLTGETTGLYAQLHGLTSAPPGAVAVVPQPGVSVPIRVLGAVHAGEPEEAWEIDADAPLLEEIAKRHPGCYALIVNGDCMDRVFPEGSVIFADPEMEPRDGSIAIVQIEGDTVVRRLKTGGNTWLLVSESHGEHADIVIDSPDASCEGVVFWWQTKGEIG